VPPENGGGGEPGVASSEAPHLVWQQKNAHHCGFPP